MPSPDLEHLLKEVQAALQELEAFLSERLHATPIDACRSIGRIKAQVDHLICAGLPADIAEQLQNRILQAESELNTLSGLHNPRLNESRKRAAEQAATLRQAVSAYFPSAVKYLLTAHGAAAIACLGAIATAFDKPLIPPLVATMAILAEGLVSAAMALPLNYTSNVLAGTNWEALSSSDGTYKKWRYYTGQAANLLASASLGYSLYLLQRAIHFGAANVLQAYYKVGAPFFDP